MKKTLNRVPVALLATAWALILCAILAPAFAQFSPGQVLNAQALNAALAAPTITGGSINNAPIGGTTPRGVTATTVYAGTITSAVIVGTVTGTVPLASTAVHVSAPDQPAITSVGTLTGLTVTGRINGTVSQSLNAGTVTGAAQPAITSVGSLTGLTVAGNVTATTGVFGTLTATVGTLPYATTATNVVGGVGSLTNLTVTNVIVGSVNGNSLNASNVLGASQPLITSVGSLTGLTVTGAVGIGSAPFASSKVLFGGTAPASSSLTFGLYNGLTLDPLATSSAYLNYTVPAIATGGTVGTLAHYYASQGTFTGSNTNQYGFAAASNLTGASNNFGFHSAIASGTGRYNFYAAGTAANFFQGTTTFATQGSFAAGSAAAPGVQVGADQSGLYQSASGNLDVTVAGVRQAQFPASASAVNYLNLTGSATAQPVTISTGGSDVNRGLTVNTAGTGTFRVALNGTDTMRVSTASNVGGYWDFTFNSAINEHKLVAQGGTNLGLSSSGGGGLAFYTNNTLEQQVAIARTASAINYLSFTGSTSGAPTSIATGGSDTNRGIALTPAGTGTLQISAHKVYTGPTAPTVAAGAADCGTSPAIVGRDGAMRVTVGSGANGSKCTITFGQTWGTAPVCTVANETTANILRPAPTTSTLVINGVLVAGDSLVAQCVGY